MIGCRKIYSNLLLLSVMLFMLGGAVRPVVPGWEPSACHCSWCEPNHRQPFQWDNSNAPLVYRHVHVATLLSVTGSELIVPEEKFELLKAEDFTAYFDAPGTAVVPALEEACAPRAPPVSA